MSRCQIEITATAKKQLGRATEWWQENRPENPELVEDEYAEAIARLKDAPMAGSPHVQARIQGVRKLLLPRTQYSLFYRVYASKQLVRIVAVWHAARGKGPPLR